MVLIKQSDRATCHLPEKGIYSHESETQALYLVLRMNTDIHQLVLRTDVAGMPLEWVDYREAVRDLGSRLPGSCSYVSFEYPGLGSGSNYHRGSDLKKLLT